MSTDAVHASGPGGAPGRRAGVTLAVGQSGGPTAALNASLVGVLREAARQPGIQRVLGLVHGLAGLLDEDLLDLTRLGPELLERLRHTPSAALGSVRRRLRDEDLERVLGVLRKHDVRYLAYAGGNDSADTSLRLARAAEQAGYPLQVMGIPKTIDNDLLLTDHCPGYGSIARYTAISTMDSGKDTEAMHHSDPIKLLEVMGRNAGWIAASAALGKRDELDPPHLIYFPERGLDYDRFLADVEEVYTRVGYAVIVVPEEIRDSDGEPVGRPDLHAPVDAFGHANLVGAAARLCDLIAHRLRVKARYDKPGTLQRMSMTLASTTDLQEAEAAGAAAVRALVAGESGYMVTLVREDRPEYRCTTGLAPLAEIANGEKLLPDAFINAAGNFVADGFYAYALPLVGGPLPQYARLPHGHRG